MKKIHFISVSNRIIATFALTTLACWITSADAAPPPAVSDLLEKGIYSEESKGDMDAAIQLYEQVIADSQAARVLAAQAQYRLGVCYYKKRDFTRASEAFETLLQKYPDQKAWVAKAREYLAGAAVLLPPPWKDGEELYLEIKSAAGLKVGSATYGVESVKSGNRKLWRVHSKIDVPQSAQASWVEVEADTFRPLRSHWSIPQLGTADTVYFPDHAEIKYEGKEEVKKVELEGLVYDNEEVIQLIRRLPLNTNYTTTLSVFTSLGGGNIVPIKVEVTALEKLDVAAGSFDCYRVYMPMVKQSFWFSADEHRYLVKFDAGGVSTELASVSHNKKAEKAPKTKSESQF